MTSAQELLEAAKEPYTPEERAMAAARIDEILDSDTSVERIGKDGYSPGILDVQCELSRLRAAISNFEAAGEMVVPDSRISELEGLVREYRHQCFHPFSENVRACSLCKSADTILGGK